MSVFNNICECDTPLVFAEEPDHCTRCGKGACAVPKPIGVRQLRRLPQNLGAIARTGSRPDPHLENVVQLDRLRKIDPRTLTPSRNLTAYEKRVLALIAEGSTPERISVETGMSPFMVHRRLHSVYEKLGLDGRDRTEARLAAVEWWQGTHRRDVAA